jgi:magnesium-transporting ATPase (P-type)
LNNTLRWILIIIGLLLFVGAATIILPALLDAIGGNGGRLIETTNEPLTVTIAGYLLGDELTKIQFVNDVLNDREVDPLLYAIAAAGALTVAMFGMAIGLGIMMRLGDRLTTGTINDENYQQAVKTLSDREQEDNKRLLESQPPTPEPAHVHPRWDAFSTGFVIVMFVAFTSVMIVQTLRPDLTVNFLGTLVPVAIPLTLIMVLITGIILAFTLKPKRLAAVDGTDSLPVNWSIIWVLISGLIILGIGTGVMIAIRSVGG